MPRNLHLASLLATATLCTGCGQAGDEIQNLGSDTMLEVAGAWAQAYHDAHPEAVVSVSGGGSGTGIAALIAGDVDIANCSRALKPSEIEQAKQHGHTPVQHHVGYDGIAIYVHKDNPIESITLAQLRDVFGEGGTVTRWSQLGVKMANEADDAMVLVSRQNNSGTYAYFQEAVLGGDSGRFKRECRLLNGSKDVVEFCGQTHGAIGYSGVAYATKAVRIVPVAKAAESAAVSPTNQTVLDGSYPISRPLFMYTNGEPTGKVKHYLDWIKSDAGQHVLKDHGYPPLRPL